MNIQLSAKSQIAKVSAVTIILFIFSGHIPVIYAENILFFANGISSHSHRVGLEPLAIKLADRGHNITFFTPLENKAKSKHPNITELCTQELIDYNHQFLTTYGISGLKSKVKSKSGADVAEGTELFDMAFKMVESILKSAEVHSLFQSSKFDMIIMDKTTLGEVIHTFAHKYNIKKIIWYMGGGGFLPFDFDLNGIPREVSWAPTLWASDKAKKILFYERLKSEFTLLSWYFGYIQFYLPKIDQLAREEFKLEKMPPLQELLLSVSLVFINSHYSDTFPRSLPPFVVQVGGMHLQESNGILPPGLENFLSTEEINGSDGFIYVSFGSIIKISTLPPKFIRIFLDAFKSMDKLKFLWKWEGEFPKNIPENVLMQKWFPQQEILAHPKVRGFVTQGGQVSIQQAIFNAVPLIIFPVDGDHDYNANRIRSVGNGIEMEFFDLTVEGLKDAINKLLIDKSYSRVASQLSQASKKRLMHPVDLAVWWTEFVLRQDDVSYLKPQTQNVTWWVTRSLDIYAFCFVSLIILTMVIGSALYYIIRWLLALLFCKSQTLSEQQRAKKRL